MAKIAYKDIIQEKYADFFIKKLLQLDGQKNVLKLESTAKSISDNPDQEVQTLGAKDFVVSGLVLGNYEWDFNGRGTKKQATDLVTKIKKLTNRTRLEVVGRPKTGRFKYVNSTHKAGGKFKQVLFVRYTQISKDSLKTGPSGGSGGGATKTELAESAACLATAWMAQGYGELKDSDFRTKKAADATVQILNKFVDLGPLDTRSGIQKVFNFLKDPKNEDWLKASTSTAKILVSELKLTKQHVFHRNSKFMNDLYDEAQVHLKKIAPVVGVKVGGEDQSMSIGGDKWNPGDIWITKKADPISWPLWKGDDVESVPTLNAKVLKSFTDKDIMGISLKKVGTIINFTKYNFKGQQRTFSFKEIKHQTTAKLMDSKDTYIECLFGRKKTSFLLQIRTFDTNNNIQTEVKGKTAAAGKAGFGAVEYALKKLTNDGGKLHTHQNIESWSQKKQIEHVQSYYTECYGGSKPTEKAILDACKKKTKGTKKIPWPNWTKAQQDDYFTSKIQSLQIASIIKKAKEKDEIITVIMAYAMSLGLKDVFKASAYAKVY